MVTELWNTVRVRVDAMAVGKVRVALLSKMAPHIVLSHDSNKTRSRMATFVCMYVCIVMSLSDIKVCMY